MQPENVGEDKRKRRLSDFRKEKGIISGTLAGGGAKALTDKMGLNTLAHAKAHEVALNYFADTDAEAHVYNWDAFIRMLESPTEENFTKWITSAEQTEAQVADWWECTHMTPNENAENFGGWENAYAFSAAAGCLTDAAIGLAEFYAGYKLRKTHPAAGNCLMTHGMITWIYPVWYSGTAVMMNPQELEMAASYGHDWALFSALTEIPPEVPFLGFGLSLPLLYLGLHVLEKRKIKKKERREALGRPLKNGQMAEEVYACYERRHPKLEKYRERLLENNNEKRAKKLAKEYRKFTDYMISQNREIVDAERKRYLGEDIVAIADTLDVGRKKARKIYGYMIEGGFDYEHEKTRRKMIYKISKELDFRPNNEEYDLISSALKQYGEGEDVPVCFKEFTQYKDRKN